MSHAVCDPKAILAGINAQARLTVATRMYDLRTHGDLKWSREFRRPITILLDSGHVMVGVVMLYSERQEKIVFAPRGQVAFIHLPFYQIAATEVPQ